MPDTVAAVQNTQLGPGTLKLGATGTQLDASCLVNNAVIAADKDEQDSTTKLCGSTRAGSRTYTYTLSGNVDTDIGTATGLFGISQSNAGQAIAFEFVPNTAKVTKAVGTLILDPLDFGADEMGADLTSDFEWSIVGKPTYTYGGTALEAEEAPAEGAA